MARPAPSLPAAGKGHAVTAGACAAHRSGGWVGGCGGVVRGGVGLGEGGWAGGRGGQRTLRLGVHPQGARAAVLEEAQGRQLDLQPADGCGWMAREPKRSVEALLACFHMHASRHVFRTIRTLRSAGVHERVHLYLELPKLLQRPAAPLRRRRKAAAAVLLERIKQIYVWRPAQEGLVVEHPAVTKQRAGPSGCESLVPLTPLTLHPAQAQQNTAPAPGPWAGEARAATCSSEFTRACVSPRIANSF